MRGGLLVSGEQRLFEAAIVEGAALSALRPLLEKVAEMSRRMHATMAAMGQSFAQVAENMAANLRAFQQLNGTAIGTEAPIRVPDYVPTDWSEKP